MTSSPKRRMLPALAGAGIAALVLPASAPADSLDAAENGVLKDSAAINTLWVTIAAVLVLFMLAGLLRLEAGLRVSAEAEIAGLDISEHGMYGYPEQFIPDAELYGDGAGAAIKLNGGRPAAPAGAAETAPA